MDLFSLTATLFCLAQKIQNCHWNISGSSFLEIHRMLGDQYEELRKQGDIFAEDMRQLQIDNLPTIQDIAAADIPPFRNGAWDQMLSNLLYDFENLADQVNMIASDQRGISNNLDDLHGYLQKQAWFLRSYLE